MKRIVVLASGAGTNFSAVLQGISAGEIQNAAVVGLITDRASTRAADTARTASIPVTEMDYGSYLSRDAFDAELLKRMEALHPDLVLALGFMRILSPVFVAAYKNRIINVHPSLLPAFPGMNAQKQAIDYSAKVTGVTVHFMDAGVDSGPIILQKATEIPDGCNVEMLRDILRPIEHELVIRAVSLFANNRIQVSNRHVFTIPTEEVPI